MAKKFNKYIIFCLSFIIIFPMIFYFIFFFNEKDNVELKCKNGIRHDFEVSYKSKGNYNLDFISENNGNFEFELNGSVKELCENNGDDFLYIKYDFNDTNIFGKNENKPYLIHDSNVRNKFIYLKLNKLGEILDIVYEKELDRLLSNVYKDYIENSIVNFKNYVNKDTSWKFSYKKLDVINNFIFHKNKQKITRIFVDNEEYNNVNNKSDRLNPESVVKRIYSTDSNTEFFVNQDNYPINVIMIRKSESYMFKKLISKDDTYFQKNFMKYEKENSTEKIINYFSNINENYIKTDLSAKDVLESLEKKSLLVNLKHENFKKFLEKVDWKDKTKYTEYFLQLTSLFVLKPEVLKDVEDYLVSINENSDEFLLIQSSLLAANTDNAQSVIRNVFLRVNDENAKTISIINLGFFDNPSIDTENFIRENMKSSDERIKQTSILAYGNIGKKISKFDQDRYEFIYNDLSKMYLNSNDNSLKKVTILSLGNLSEPRIYNLIKQELSSENELIKKSSIFALRYIDAEEINKDLYKILESSSSVNVRSTVIEVISYRIQTKELIELQKFLLRNDASESIRSGILKNLDQLGLKDELIYAKENDLSKSIRNYAESLLAKYQ